MATINVSDLTTTEIDGTGVFDQLMKAVSAQLTGEFNKGRIQSSDYSKVYLGALDSVMQQSLSFLLQKQTSDKQAELISNQSDNEIKRGLILDQELLKSTAEIEILNKQVGKLTQDIAIGVQQEALLVKEILQTIEQTAKTTQDIAQSQSQVLNLLKQRDKMDSEIALINQQKLNSVTQGTIFTNTALKVSAEKDLLTQKSFTEEAQTKDTVNGSLVDGVIGKQKSLFAAQTDGFKRDAEQKALKIILDAWSVARSTDPNSLAVAIPAEMNTDEINLVLAKLKLGIGVT